MTDASAASSGKVHCASSENAAVAGQSELRLWAILAIVSLGLGGLFALMLAVSRIPGAEKIAVWPADFFAKALIIHVIFTLMVWFLGVFALLASMATYDITEGKPRLAWLGRAGLALFGMSFPLLFIPAFKSESIASLNNYVPVLIHPAYYLGLVVLAVAVLLPVVRLLANFPGRTGRLPPLPLAMSAGGVIYIAALVCFALALRASWGEMPSKPFNEALFWGGGHVLQFLYATLMLTGWYILLRGSFGEKVIDTDIFRLAVLLVAVFSLAGPIFYMAFQAGSMKQMEALRRLQFVLAFPALLVAVGGLTGVLAARERGPLPWRSPAFTALALSALVFLVGGIMGFLVTGTDTRTPAHYHGVIAGVTLASMGLFLTYCLPRLGCADENRAPSRLPLLLFGFGQLVACLGLFWAGGYGAPRKVPSGGVELVNSAAIGMGLHGAGALVAIIGGILFVIAVARALMNHPAANASVASR